MQEEAHFLFFPSTRAISHQRNYLEQKAIEISDTETEYKIHWVKNKENNFMEHETTDRTLGRVVKENHKGFIIENPSHVLPTEEVFRRMFKRTLWGFMLVRSLRQPFCR